MKKQILTALMLFITTLVMAQSLTFENVRKVSLRNSDAIREGSEVKGYYFFYVSDKVDRKTNEYTLQITDENLKKIKDITFTDSKDVRMLESSFNGTDLIFLLYNDDTRVMEYQVYGADGKRKHTYNRELSKKERRFLEASYLQDDEDKNFKGLYPIEQKGFISLMPSREDKDYTFQLDYFATDKRRQWTYIPTEGAKRFIGDYLGTHNGVVYLEVLKFKSNSDQKPDSYLTGISLETGKLLFEKVTDKSNHRMYPATLSVINGNAFVFGEYFAPNGNIMKDKSLGFAFWGVDEKGEITSEKYNSWAFDLGKHLTVTSKGKIDDFGFMYLHNMVQTEDGIIYAIGEGYQKTASALGIATQLISGGRSNISVVKMKVTDLILIQFDTKFAVKKATIYEKNANKVELPSGYELVSTPLIGKIIKAFGDFDYSYMQVNKDKTSFSVCYADTEKIKGGRVGTFNSITVADGKITTDKVAVTKGATATIVLPSRQGQVLMLDYYKKAKKIEAHFEKLN